MNLNSLNLLLRAYGFPPIHEHNYTEVEAKYKENKTLGFSYLTTISTLVLHRCECGDKFVQELDGEWTLEEIQGITHP